MIASVSHRRDAEVAERKFLCLVAETPTRQNSSALRAIKITIINVTSETIPVGGFICIEFAEGRLFFAFRPLNGKQKE